MTAFVRRQLMVFVILSVAAFATIALVYVRVPTLLGAGQMSVTAQVPAAGGIYPNALVTYRGYSIGKVTDVRLVPGGVDVVMSIDEDLAPPAESRAEVHSVSAIGEQYVDFVPPETPGSAVLADGAVITRDRTSIPTPTADVLDDVDGLLASVDQDDLTVVLDEFDTAFRDLGPSLAAIADNTDLLLRTAEDAYPQTEQLIGDLEPFLDSQIASADSARSWAGRLAAVTDQLAQSDGDLRSLLDNGPGAAENVGNLLDTLRGTTPTLLDNTLVLTELAEAYNMSIEQVLVVYPAFVRGYSNFLGPAERQQLNLNLKLSPNTPNCFEGWVGPGAPGGPRTAYDIADADFPADTYCKLPQSDERVVRGSRNLPCFEPGSPEGRRAATIEQCRGDGFEPTSTEGTQLQIGGPLRDVPIFTEETPTPADMLATGGAGPPATDAQGLEALLLGS